MFAAFHLDEQLHRAARARKTSPLAAVVSEESRAHIFGDPGVQRTIPAAKNVDRPRCALCHGSYDIRL